MRTADVETERPGVPNMVARRLAAGRCVGSRWPTTPEAAVNAWGVVTDVGQDVGVGTAKGYGEGVGVAEPGG